MSDNQSTTENGVTRYDDPSEIYCKLRFMAYAMGNTQGVDFGINDDEGSGLMFILSEIADIVRTFERGTE